jgi:hypothetical protein
VNTASKTQRVSAATIAVAMTFSIVWAMSGYAYPGSSAFAPGQMAKDVAPVVRVAKPS